MLLYCLIMPQCTNLWICQWETGKTLINSIDGNQTQYFFRISIYACDTSLWLVLHNLGYLIMLTIMAFNLWIFLSVLVGGGLGYFVFGQMFMKLNLENCQVIRDTYCMSTCSKPGIKMLWHCFNINYVHFISRPNFPALNQESPLIQAWIPLYVSIGIRF